jgi:transposase
VDTTQGSAGGGRGRRRHSDEFKGEVVRACRVPGVSIAAVSLSYGLNANMVRRWLMEPRTVAAVMAGPGPGPGPVAAATRAPLDTQPKFVPLRLTDGPTPQRDIHIELRRGPTTVVVNWPVREAAACAAWLREWLR